MTLVEIKKKLATIKPELHERFGVADIAVFGSFVRGEQKRGSDIDILVNFDRSITLFGLYDLQEFLKKKLRKKVDIAVMGGLKEHIGKSILSEAQFV